MTARLELAGGGTAEILATDGQSVVLLCPVPAPPGSTLDLSFAGDARRVQVKVRGSRRADLGSPGYRVEGRFVNLGRELRDRIIDATGPAGSGRA